MKTKSDKTKRDKTKSDKTSTTKFDYAAMKSVANEHEREGRWAEAAAVWSDIAAQSPNKMIVDNAKRRAKTALSNVATDDTQATRHTVASSGGEPVEVVAPGRESDAPTAPDARDGAPVEDAAPPATPPANDVPTGEPGANDAQMDATAAPAPKPSRDLPPVGTVIQKRDRKGILRCECKVVDGGIEYQGTTYKSLSSAALAASKDLGLGASTLDGWSWWGLKTRPAVATAKKDVVASLERAFAKYVEKADAMVKATTGDDARKVLGALRSHGTALLAMTDPTESADS